MEWLSGSNEEFGAIGLGCLPNPKRGKPLIYEPTKSRMVGRISYKLKMADKGVDA